MKNENSEKIKITGAVERIVFQAEDTGFTVARISSDKSDNVITVVGKMAALSPGVTGVFTGEWVRHKQYGKQLQVDSFRETMPATLKGIEKYLGSGMVKGVGKEFAARLVKKFGEDTLDVIENEPHRLKEVEGIGRKRLKMITSAWQGQKAVRDVMVFLQGHGIGPQRAVKIFKTYGDDTISKLKKNPFRLASDVWGIGFKVADQFARNMGFDVNSPDRAKAALLHVLFEASSEGHCYLPMDELKKRCVEKLDVPENVMLQVLEEMLADRRLVQEDDRVFLSSLHRFELNVCEKIIQIMDVHPLFPVQNVDEAVKHAEAECKINLAKGQRDALYKSLKSKFSIITGGPGVGKTSILRVLVKVLEDEQLTFALCAPTGRAAKRMTESIGHEAKTIHRMLKFTPGSGRFQLEASQPLDCRWLIVDEMSMVDLPLFNFLLKSVDPETNVVLVGDADQLPSVGPGMVLNDLIECGVLPVSQLTEIYRQKADSNIVMNAHRINRGRMPHLPDMEKGRVGDFYFVECDDPDRAEEIIIKMVAERIPKRFGLDAIDQVQVLSPMKKRSLGALELNDKLQQVLNPLGNEHSGVREGDKVMQLRNNYDKMVFNGDMGRVVEVSKNEEVVRVDFDGEIVEYDFAELDEVRPAYACTVHKSQGSEFPAVVLPLYTGHFILLQRNLLYTAITRAEKLVVMVGSKKALYIAVNNDKVKERYTSLKQRLQKMNQSADSRQMNLFS